MIDEKRLAELRIWLKRSDVQNADVGGIEQEILELMDTVEELLKQMNILKCPICDGTGLVSRQPGIAGDQITFTSSNTGPWKCQRCYGIGTITVLFETS